MSRVGSLCTLLVVAALACGCPPGFLFPTPPTPQPTPRKPPPTPLSLHPWIEARLQAIRLRSDEGNWMAAINAEEVRQWVEAANVIFGASGIRFVYDAEQDFTTLDSTLLNSMDSRIEDDELFLANTVASHYPDRLVIFFREGALDASVLEGFSSLDLDFVAMPDFDQEICAQHYRSMLAHEIGHYLGLNHTFAQTFSSVEGAEVFFERFGRAPTVFDGDGIADTPPDPFVEDMVCGPEETLVLDGVAFPLPVDNVMSYYANPTSLSEQQAVVARWVLTLRQGNGMAMPVNAGAPFCVEVENPEVRRIAGGSTEAESMGGFWEEGDQLLVDADAGAELDLVFHVPRTGRYRVSLCMTYGPDYGQIEARIDGRAVGEPFDAYGPLVTTSGPVALGELNLSVGEHILGLVVTGKNPESSGYSFGIDCLSLVPLD